jgi:hypothetical protein
MVGLVYLYIVKIDYATSEPASSEIFTVETSSLMKPYDQLGKVLQPPETAQVACHKQANQ